MPEGHKQPRRPRSETHSSPEQDRIATMLVVMLVFTFCGIGAAFLIMISVRMLIGLVVAVFMVVAYTATHYLLWGRKLREQENQIERWWEVGTTEQEKQEVD